MLSLMLCFEPRLKTHDSKLKTIIMYFKTLLEMKKILLFFVFLFVFGFAKSQTVKYQVVIIFKPTTTWAHITTIKTALNAIQRDSTFPSRALLWDCTSTVGATITIPDSLGNLITSATITALGAGGRGSGSEAVGVICNSGQSEGVSLNGVYIIPERDNAGQSDVSTSIFGFGCNTSASDSIVTCAAGTRAVRMAIMDSGIDATVDTTARSIAITHDSLRSWVAYRSEPIDNVDNDANGYKDDQIGYDFVNNQGLPKDSTGHGTFVAGVVSRILSRNSGTGTNIKFYVLKVLDANNRGYEYNFIRAIDWAAKQKEKVEVINCSFISSDVLLDPLSPFASAIATAKTYAGILVSVAAGNRSKNLDFDLYGAASFTSENTIVTGATACTDSIAWFSNFGKRNTDVFTIGKNIVSTWLGKNVWAIHSGTSYAAPQTTAIAGLLSSRLVSAPLNWQKVKCSIMMGESYRVYLLAKSRRSGMLNGVNSANNLATITYPCDGLVNTEGVYENLKNVVVFPNPTEKDVMVNYYLTKNTPVSLTVLNIMGQILSTETVNSTFGLNEHPLSIKGGNGVYFVQIRVENEVVLRKVVKFEP
jgi:hypothetical protein